MKRVRRRNPTPFFFFSLKTVRISNNLATLSLSLLITLNVAASIQQALYTNNTTETELSPNGASIAFAKTSSGADPDQTSAAFLRTFANEISHLVRILFRLYILPVQNKYMIYAIIFFKTITVKYLELSNHDP